MTHECPTCAAYAAREEIEAKPLEYGDEHRRMLRFEESWWRKPGAKDQAIITTFGLSVIRYYQLLNKVLALPSALAEFPAVVHRLRRVQMSGMRRRLAWR